MKRWVLIFCHDKIDWDNLRTEWQKEGMSVHIVSDFTEIIKNLSGKFDYLLIIIFIDNNDYLSILEVIRNLTKAPILIVSHQYDSAEKIAAIEAGADEYMKWSEDHHKEVVSSGRALIRRYTELNQADQQLPNILSRGALIMSVDYRKVFIHEQEVVLPRKEFDLLYFLASNSGRVFTNEQLYSEVWGEDYLRDADSGLHSCLNRIRRKLEEVPNVSCHIENLRGVGYRFVQDNTE